MHPDETQKLRDLQKGKSAEEQHKLAAAECALTRCAEGVPESDPDKEALTKLQNEGAKYPDEQRQLKDAGAFDGYGWADTFVDFNDRNRLTTRAGGAVQGVGMASLAALVAGGGCSTGVGCALALTAAGTSLDYSLAGFKAVVSGDPASTYGEQVLQGLGMSPTGAALAYGFINGGAAGGSTLANGIGNTGTASASDGSRVAEVPRPITSGGTANAATGPGLSADLAIAQSKDPLIGSTLPGATAPVQVTADASIGGKSFFDVNQTARGTGFGEANQPTLIASFVEKKEFFFALLERLLREGKVMFIAPGADCYVSPTNPTPGFTVEDPEARWSAPVSEIMNYVRSRWPAEVSDETDVELTCYFYELPGLIWISDDGRFVVS